MTTPELLFETMAPLTGHNTTWTLKHDGQTIDVKLERGTRVLSIDNLNTGRSLKPTSKRGQIIVAPVLDAYVAQFGDGLGAEEDHPEAGWHVVAQVNADGAITPPTTHAH